MNKKYPEIKGVEFRSIPEYEGYAMSNDGHVWNGNNGWWRKMKPYRFCDGDMVVRLPVGQGGFTIAKVNDLMSVFQ